jgi:hypothetical protein
VPAIDEPRRLNNQPFWLTGLPGKEVAVMFGTNRDEVRAAPGDDDELAWYQPRRWLRFPYVSTRFIFRSYHEIFWGSGPPRWALSHQ